MKNKLYLINGPLGAGKTTLLKFLIQQTSLANARVIENEFASISVDSEELHDHVKEIETIAGLCICCSTGEELIDALKKLSTEHRPVIIEATGVANSLKLVEKLVVNDMLDLYEISKAFFVIDAAEINLNPEIVQIYQHELEASDLIVLTKTDLLNTSQKDAVLASISNITDAQVTIADMGVFDAALLSENNLTNSGILEYFVGSDAPFINHDDDTNYSIIDTSEIALSAEQLGNAWERLREAYGLKRLKGNITDTAGVSWHLEATPSQFTARQQTSAALQSIVVIGSKARLVTTTVLKETL